MDNGNPFPQRKHLKRIPVWLPDELPVIYHVTVGCAWRRRLFVERKHVHLAVECLQRADSQHAWNVWNSCFMPDHVHLLLSPTRSREQPLAAFVQAWKICVTLRLHRVGMIGNIWQAEFFDHLLRTDEKLGETWEYIRMNPVRAGICELPGEYPFSGRPEDILARIGKGE